MAGAKPADFGFAKLVVGDLERCGEFYRSVCGLVESGRYDAEIGGRAIREILFRPTSPGGATLVLLAYFDDARPGSGESILGFSTPDLDAFVSRALAAGGSLFREARDMDDLKVRVAFVRDVEGHLIEVVQPL
jgi:catechol 2,3-dioxygenase-like lactoylglutathione lyase family enzyme